MEGCWRRGCVRPAGRGPVGGGGLGEPLSHAELEPCPEEPRGAGGWAYAALAGVKSGAENLSVLEPHMKTPPLGALCSGCFDPGLPLSQVKEVWGLTFLRFLSFAL